MTRELRVIGGAWLCDNCKATFSTKQAADLHVCACSPIVSDEVDHPVHYTSHPSGVECISVVEHFNFNRGNAIKYIWRADLKNGIEDLRKAKWYIEREIERLENEARKASRD